MAATYLAKTSKQSGEAAHSGEISKKNKYGELEGRFHFVPFSVETFGPWGDEAKKLISAILNKINYKSTWLHNTKDKYLNSQRKRGFSDGNDTGGARSG